MKRGRKSAGDMSVVSSITDVRPAPTEDLTEEQAEEWRAVVRRLPHDFFPRETHSMLGAFCKHATAHRFLSQEIDRFERDWLKDDEGLKRYSALSAVREREARAMFAAARALRITKQAQLRPETAGRALQGTSFTGRRPWDEAPILEHDAAGDSD